MACRHGLTSEQEVHIIQQAGKQVAARRKALGMSQEELGEAVGIVKSAISLFECGRRLPKMLNGLRIAAVLRMGMGDMFSAYEQTLLDDTTYHQILTLLPGTRAEIQQAILYFLQVSQHQETKLSSPPLHG